MERQIKEMILGWLEKLTETKELKIIANGVYLFQLKEDGRILSISSEKNVRAPNALTRPILHSDTNRYITGEELVSILNAIAKEILEEEIVKKEYKEQGINYIQNIITDLKKELKISPLQLDGCNSFTDFSKPKENK